MIKSLEILGVFLEENRPEYYSGLNSPLKDNEIKELEIKYDIIIPDYMKELYKWKNGQNSECYESFINNSMFMTLEESLETARELTSMIGSDFEIDNWWNKYWLPIFHNGGGDYICYDTEGTFTGDKGQLIEFWHIDNDRNVIAKNLKDFIESINSIYQSSEIDNFEEIYIDKEINGYPKTFYVE